MGIRDCPAAVSGNDSRHTHWTRGVREATASRCLRTRRAHESEDLPVARTRPIACGVPVTSWAGRRAHQADVRAEGASRIRRSRHPFASASRRRDVQESSREGDFRRYAAGSPRPDRPERARAGERPRPAPVPYGRRTPRPSPRLPPAVTVCHRRSYRRSGHECYSMGVRSGISGPHRTEDSGTPPVRCRGWRASWESRMDSTPSPSSSSPFDQVSGALGATSREAERQRRPVLPPRRATPPAPAPGQRPFQPAARSRFSAPSTWTGTEDHPLQPGRPRIRGARRLAGQSVRRSAARGGRTDGHTAVAAGPGYGRGACRPDPAAAPRRRIGAGGLDEHPARRGAGGGPDRLR